MCEYPESLRAHPRVEKIYNDRKAMYQGEKLLDWGMAETMAYATLLDEGVNVRLSGEDAGRGTFSIVMPLCIIKMMVRGMYH